MRWLDTALVTACILAIVSGTVPRHCHVDEPCFPTNSEFYQFSRSLDGGVLWPSDEAYSKIIVLHNAVFTKFPIAVAVVLSTEDVQRSVRFARKYNLRVTVMSSGHDYNGRSTAHESLMIYLGAMNKTKVNLTSSRNPAGEMMCESGNTWLKVYSELTQYGRVIVGGSAHTVAMGGYTLGGGHSPMSRMFGMAVDNLLEVEMVTADGSIVRADEKGTTWLNDDGTTRTTTDNDIFWALRGGGGGTFGIVTKFTYKLHYAAQGVVTFSCLYPMILANRTNVGYDILEHIGSLIPGLPKQWGGYLILSYSHDTTADTYGTIGLFMNHYGTWDSPSRAYADHFSNYKPELQVYCKMFNVSNFIEYEVNAKDAPTYTSALFNVLMQNDSFTKEWAKFTIDKVIYDHPIQDSSVSLTGTLLGGKMQEVGIHDTAVHPGWRSSYMSLSGSVSWNPGNGIPWEKAMDEAKVLSDEQIKFGLGMYPNESGPNVTNWHDNFWGSNYQRLLQIKRKWDPDRFFYCSQCVGSDDNQPAHVNIGPIGPFGQGMTDLANDTSIFWALRGGGGGTFGLVTKFTYRLHYPASAVVMFPCFYPIILQNGTNVGYDILQFIGNLIPNLPREWDGYLLITPSVYRYSGSFGTLGLLLNHYGPFDTASRSYMDKLKNYLPDIQMYCGYTNFSTFLEYENNAHDVEWYATSLFNTLMQNDSFTSDWVRFTIDSVVKSHPIPKSGVRFTGTLIEGRVSEVDEDDTPVHPGMRTSLMTLSGSLSWDPTDTKVDWRKAIEMSKSLEERLYIYGYGMYPNESGPNVTDWKNNFWGNNYHRLLDIKKKWDPEHFFYCTQCVGSEEAHLSRPLNPFG